MKVFQPGHYPFLAPHRFGHDLIRGPIPLDDAESVEENEVDVYVKPEPPPAWLSSRLLWRERGRQEFHLGETRHPVRKMCPAVRFSDDATPQTTVATPVSKGELIELLKFLMDLGERRELPRRSDNKSDTYDKLTLNEITDLLIVLTRSLIDDDTSRDLPHEPRVRVVFARIAQVLRHNTYISRLIFTYLHDFTGLRSILAGKNPEDSDFDDFLTAISLEEFLDACHFLSNRPIWSFFVYEGDLLEKTGLTDALRTYLAGHAFPPHATFSALQTTRDLLALAGQYDVAIAIAGGGLFSGCVAQILGLPTLFADIHAHGRKRPQVKWLSPVSRENFEGKRVLLLDKDAVTGATMRAARRFLAPFNPAKIGVYFNHGLANPEMGVHREALPVLNELEITPHFPEQGSATELLSAFYTLHERLKTPLGRMRLVEREFERIRNGATGDAEKQYLAAVEARLTALRKLFDNLNPMLAGVQEIRASIAGGTEKLLDEAGQMLAQPQDRFGREMLRNAAVSLSRPINFWFFYAKTLAMARYVEWGRDLARKHNIDNERIAHDHTAAFSLAQRAVKDDYDVALIVGPEGFSFAPIFVDLGLPLVAINIPQDTYGGERTLTPLDDLSQLAGKRILVVEDDIHSGATLLKLLEAIEPLGPAKIGLYLGNLEFTQATGNVPPRFSPVYPLKPNPDEDANAFWEFLIEKGVVIFKS